MIHAILLQNKQLYRIFFLKYARVQLLVTQNHIVSTNCGCEALHIVWVENFSKHSAQLHVIIEILHIYVYINISFQGDNPSFC